MGQDDKILQLCFGSTRPDGGHQFGCPGTSKNEVKMTSLKILTLGATLCALTACGESQQDLSAARSMSCTQLARVLGRREQRRESAAIDSIGNTLTSALTDDKELERSAAIEGLVNNVDEMDANRSIEQLNAIYRAKGCA